MLQIARLRIIVVSTRSLLPNIIEMGKPGTDGMFPVRFARQQYNGTTSLAEAQSPLSAIGNRFAGTPSPLRSQAALHALLQNLNELRRSQRTAGVSALPDRSQLRFTRARRAMARQNTRKRPVCPRFSPLYRTVGGGPDKVARNKSGFNPECSNSVPNSFGCERIARSMISGVMTGSDILPRFGERNGVIFRASP
jgi:hypothetical protein